MASESPLGRRGHISVGHTPRGSLKQVRSRTEDSPCSDRSGGPCGRVLLSASLRAARGWWEAGHRVPGVLGR